MPTRKEDKVRRLACRKYEEKIRKSVKVKAPNRKLESSSWNYLELKTNLSLALDYITAPPKMALYLKYST